MSRRCFDSCMRDNYLLHNFGHIVEIRARSIMLQDVLSNNFFSVCLFLFVYSRGAIAACLSLEGSSPNCKKRLTRSATD